MPDLLLELRSEEIPARMQRKAAGDLRKMVTDGLVEAGLTYEGCQEYWTPRRLTLDIRGVTARSSDVSEEKRGPKVGAPQAALDGFLRSAGLTEITQAEIQSDPKKGDFYVARIVRPGRGAEEIIAALLPAVIRTFPWPKSMRWGKASAEPGSLRWVRPLQSIVCTFGPETSEPEIVRFDVDGIRSGNVTWGHRFHAPEPITVRRFEDYAAKLEAAKVVIDADRRKRIILADAQNLAFASGLELVEDEGLLEEVSGLVEWPVVLMGEFEEAFLDIPPEVIRLTIRANQKCFVTRAPISPLVGEMSAKPTEGGAVPPTSPHADDDGRPSLPPAALPGISPPRGEIGQSQLSNRFILTSNIEAKDGGVEIAYGNGKVVRARLSDALYFWKTDQGDLPDLAELEGAAKKFGLKRDTAGKLLPLDQRMARLDRLGVTFHAKLGTQGERVQRIASLATELADRLSSQPRFFQGKVLSADELAAEQGYLRERVNRAAILAKADLTTEIVGEFPELQGAMGRKYALLQGEDASVAAAIEEHYKPQGPSDRVPTDPVSVAVALADKLDTLVGFWAIDEKPTGSKDPFALRRAALGVIRLVLENALRVDLIPILIEHGERFSGHSPIDTAFELADFFRDRLKVQLRENGSRHDLVDAVFEAGIRRAEMKPGMTNVRNLSLIVSRVEALGSFLDSEDGKNLLAGTRRAANILAAEEKKKTGIADAVDPALIRTVHEQALYNATVGAESEAAEAIAREDFGGAMRALSRLRQPVDAFFDHVLVNVEDLAVRANRLALLARIRAATGQVADFSKIEG